MNGANPVKKTGALRRAIRSIVVWQASAFFMLLLLVWLNDVLDLPACASVKDPSALNCVGPALLSVFVVLTAIVSIGQTYLKQKRILAGFVTVCAKCHKVRIEKHAWEAIERYLADRYPVEFSHGLCPECCGQELADLAAEAATRSRSDPK